MHNFLQNLKYKLAVFMQGRYGNDRLNQVLVIIALVLEVIYMFVAFLPLYVLSLVLFFLAIYRMFSRNISKRYKENQKFLNFWSGLSSRRTHHIYRCPGCRQKIRVPRKGGKKVEIRCPKCGNTFIKKI